MPLPKGQHFNTNIFVPLRGCGGKHFASAPATSGEVLDNFFYGVETLTPLVYRIEHTYSFTLIHNGNVGVSLVMNGYTFLGFDTYTINPVTKIVESAGFIINNSENNNALLSSAFFGGTPFVYLTRDGATSIGTAVEWRVVGATSIRMRWVCEFVTATGTYLNPADTVNSQSFWYTQVDGKNPPVGNYQYLVSSGYRPVNPVKSIGQLCGTIIDKFGTLVTSQYLPAEVTTKVDVPLVTYTMAIGGYSASRYKRNYDASDTAWLLACPLP